jgi:predicted dehydrogenase
VPEVRWGIVGTGTVARDFVAALRQTPGARVIGVAARSVAKAEGFAGREGAGRAYPAIESLLDDKLVDVVYVAAPTAAHHALCLSALAAGKAVLCEKPLAASATEAQEIAEAARQSGRFCMEAMWMLFAPAVRELVRLVRAGAIGELSAGSFQLGFNFDTAPGHRLRSREHAGGALLDLGAYPLSLALAVFGEPDRIQAQAMLGSEGADEQVSALLGYGGGRQVTIAASLLAKASNDATVFGTRGTIHLAAPLYFPEALTVTTVQPIAASAPRQHALVARLKQYPLVRRARALWGSLQARRFDGAVFGSGYGLEAAEVMRCLVEGEVESPVVPLVHSIAVLKVADEIRRTWIELPSQSRTTQCA